MTNVVRHERALAGDALTRLALDFEGRVRVIGPSDMTDRGV